MVFNLSFFIPFLVLNGVINKNKNIFKSLFRWKNSNTQKNKVTTTKYIIIFIYINHIYLQMFRFWSQTNTKMFLYKLIIIFNWAPINHFFLVGVVSVKICLLQKLLDWSCNIWDPVWKGCNFSYCIMLLGGLELLIFHNGTGKNNFPALALRI